MRSITILGTLVITKQEKALFQSQSFVSCVVNYLIQFFYVKQHSLKFCSI